MIGVVGAGAWGTALAQVMMLREAACLWSRTSHNPLATARMDDLVTCDVLLLATPLQQLRAVLGALPLAHRPTLVHCSKGIEIGTALLPFQIAAEAAPGCPNAILSGPTFAHDVAAGHPVAATLACASPETAGLLDRLARPRLRLYLSDDLTGVAVGGAVKNVIAIACGVVSGLGLGGSAGAAIVSRGMAEMVRYAVARGGRADTLAGLSGLGDLVLTCGSAASRNMALGEAIARGGNPAQLLSNRSAIAEGAATAPILAADARARGVDMPITQAVAALLQQMLAVDAVIESLLGRTLGRE